LAVVATDAMRNLSRGLMTIDELRALLARHFASYRAKHKERVASDGPLREEELETHEKFVDLYDRRRLASGWNDIAFDEFLAAHRVPVSEVGPALEELRMEHATQAAEYRRFLVQHSRALKVAEAGQEPLAAPVAPEAVTAPTGGSMALRELAETFTTYSVASGHWDDTTREERQRHFDLLWECVPPDSQAKSMTTAQARQVRDTLLVTPVNRNKRVETRGLPLSEQIEVPDLKKLNQRTIKKYLQTYRSMFAWAVQDGHVDASPFEKVAAPPQSRRQKSGEKTAFSGDQLRLMLRELVDNSLGLVNRPHHKWATLIAMYTGARLNEVCQLTVEDIRKHDGILCFDINDEGDEKSLKTLSSIRTVPVHPDLLDLGLLEYREQIKGEGHQRLFPNLVWHWKDRWGRQVGRWFNERFAKELGIKSDVLTFHSLRHTMVTALSRSGIDEPIIQSIVGHKREGITQGYFRAGYTLAQRRDALKQFSPENYG
jgi:integrase